MKEMTKIAVLSAFALVGVGCIVGASTDEPGQHDLSESSSHELTAGGRAGALSYPSTCPSSTVNGVSLTTCDIAPSSTGAGIGSLSPASGDYHHVVFPTASAGRSKNVLVVFLGGSASVPSSYQSISAEAASKGYGVIDLRYADTPIIGTTCSTDPCFSGLRGMTIFGDWVTVPGVPDSPYHYDGSINAANSVINRVVNLLDTLSTYDPWWAQFLTDTSSPYSSTHHAHVLPTWSKIVLAGHSQGGGHAALIGTQVTSVRRVIMFGSPDDHVGSTSAKWVTTHPSAAPVARFWGMRDTMEGNYGSCTSYNWHNLGGTSGTSCTVGDEAVHAWEFFVAQGATNAGGQQFLVTTDRPHPTALYAHDSTAVDDNIVDGSSALPFSTDRTVAWDYLFTANGTD